MLKKLISILLSFTVIFTLVGCTEDGSSIVVEKCKSNETLTDGSCVLNDVAEDLCEEHQYLIGDLCVDSEEPFFVGSETVYTPKDTSFNPLLGIDAYDYEDGVLTEFIEVISNSVDVIIEGEYDVVYSVTDSNGITVQFTRKVIVSRYANYVNGIDLSNLPGESKASIYAALEQYLVDNVIGGVPLYNNASFMMYSDRVNLFSDSYINILGYGDQFSTLTSDDSTVYFNESTQGNIDDYTFRDYYTYEPTTLNPYLSSVSSDFIILNQINGSLYTYHFNNEKDTYEITPSLAEAAPVPTSPVTINGEVTSTIWSIQIADDLEWEFHPDIDTSGYPVGFNDLDATDFLWTWQTAIDNDWFRAVSGGTDFVSRDVLNAQEYLDGEVEFSEVGVSLVGSESNTIEIEFNTPKTAFEVEYMFINNLQAVNKELYESVEASSYGTTPLTIASSGIYYLEEWINDTSLLLSKNDNYPDASQFSYSNYSYILVNDDHEAYLKFIDGYLDKTVVPIQDVDSVLEDERLKTIEQSELWSLHINGFKTNEQRDDYFSSLYESYEAIDYDVEPILGYLEMKQALYYAIDRGTIINDYISSKVPTSLYFPDLYILDMSTGETVRTSEEGSAVSSSYPAYSSEYATALFKEAITKAVADGYYLQGTSEVPLMIDITLSYTNLSSEYIGLYIDELISQLETTLYDDINHIGVNIIPLIVTTEEYTQDGLIATTTDLSISGLSNSITRESATILERYRDDNITSYTMDYGIDTHTAVIEVTYQNMEGLTVTEVWSYNALAEALKGKVLIKEGIVQGYWDDLNTLYSGTLSLQDEIVNEITDGEELASIILGQSLDTIVESEHLIDFLHANIVSTESNRVFLIITSVNTQQYSIFMMEELFLEPEGAAIAFIYENYTEDTTGFSFVDTPLTNEEIESNTYLNSIYDTPTLSSIADDLFVNEDYLELYKTTWPSFDLDDAFAIIHYMDYYFAVEWL